MHGKTLIIFVSVIIVALVLQTAALFLASVIRRGHHSRKYRKLDRLRATCRAKLLAAFESGQPPLDCKDEFAATPGSPQWQATKEVLLALISEGKYEAQAGRFFGSLGYTMFCEERLGNSSPQMRAESIHNLGRMKSVLSVPKLIPLLAEHNGEIASVTMRALSNIGGERALRAIVGRLPHLLGNGAVSPKAVETALLAFGPSVLHPLTEHWGAFANPRVATSVLEVLSRLPADARAVPPALEALTAESPEVRSKALKVLGRREYLLPWPDLPERMVPLLHDTVWYVRLQALRTLRELGCERTVTDVGKLLYDEKWQVRNEAARALLQFRERSFDILLEALTDSDRYAKDSVCEEIVNTDFSPRLMGYCEGEDPVLREKAGRILEAMRSNGFTAPFERGASAGGNGGKRRDEERRNGL